MRGDRLK